jgi:hypothetical protein
MTCMIFDLYSLGLGLHCRRFTRREETQAHFANILDYMLIEHSHRRVSTLDDEGRG